MAGIEVALCPKSETDAGLELLIESIRRQVRDGGHFVETHSVARLVVAQGASNALLVETPDGYRVLLTRWNAGWELD